MTDHGALLDEIARAQKPVTTRKCSPKRLYERVFDLLYCEDNRDANAPALLVTAEGVAQEGQLPCEIIVSHHPQLTSFAVARGPDASRVLWRSRLAV